MLALGPEWSSNFLSQREFDGLVDFGNLAANTPSLMSLSSHELHTRLLGYLARFRADPTPNAHRRISVGHRPYLGRDIFCAAVWGFCLLARGDEYLDEIIAAFSALSIPPEGITDAHVMRNGEWAMINVLGHPNLQGNEPYDYVALFHRLVRVIVRMGPGIGCFYAQALKHVVENADMGPRLLETLPDEMLSWVVSLPLPSEYVGDYEVENMISGIYSLLLSCEHTVGRLIEIGFLTRLLDDHTAISNQGRPKFGQWSIEEYLPKLMLIEAPTTRTAAWEAFLDARIRFVSCLVENDRQEAMRYSHLEEQFWAIICSALFHVKIPQLESDLVMDVSPKWATWFVRFTNSLKDRTWDTDGNVRSDLVNGLHLSHLKHIPKSGLRALAGAIRTPRGGNVLHRILEAFPNAAFSDWSALLDVADITEMDDDMRSPSSFMENPGAFVGLLLDYRLDFATRARTVVPFWLQQFVNQKDSMRLVSNIELLRLERRGLFHSLESASLLLECVRLGEYTEGHLRAMTLFKLIWSSRIAFGSVNQSSSLRTACTKTILKDEHRVWDGCLRRVLMATALTSVKVTSIRASKSSQSCLGLLSVDLLRLILAYVWHGPKHQVARLLRNSEEVYGIRRGI